MFLLKSVVYAIVLSFISIFVLGFLSADSTRAPWNRE